MPHHVRQRLMEDVSAASAAYLCNIFPQLMDLTATERYERLRLHFETAFLAFQDGLAGWEVPEPGTN